MTITPEVTEYEDLRWPSENGSWLDYEVEQQRERFRKTHECAVLSETINNGTQLSTTPEAAEEEINDDQQLQSQNSVRHRERTLLLLKLYSVMKQLRV
ncbi:unnamed protein product [Didymodactylos carnosus]|uniref:Uncharacterized protein n=1 Tax=Didymodactylos carnosus TaxID=1234261 RepID=A0A815KQU8_9BILA|nr:unnamed protein product [Didymodactylos carnosus]CAF1399031.1 unnamed protein product [Didymodactylos carnosus]CAF3786359.1 unnamed protein product [Didymodactylos carnosus]CAF4293104.1 unnamed protein product [Didymodactylos carnosus]